MKLNKYTSEIQPTANISVYCSCTYYIAISRELLVWGDSLPVFLMCPTNRLWIVCLLRFALVRRYSSWILYIYILYTLNENHPRVKHMYKCADIASTKKKHKFLHANKSPHMLKDMELVKKMPPQQIVLWLYGLVRNI